MKLVRQTRLHLQNDKSDKLYELDLCEMAPGQYVVNFRYGRRGKPLRNGVKTAQPVGLEAAEQIFEKLLAEKVKKGYRDLTVPATKTKEEARTLVDEPIQSYENNTLELPIAHSEALLNHLLKATGTNQNPVPVPDLPQSEEIPNPPPPQEEKGLWGLFKKIISGQPNSPKHSDQKSGNTRPAPAKKKERPISRIIWRVGELRLKAAVPLLLQLPQKGDLEFLYSLAWALGRCGDSTALPRLTYLEKAYHKEESLGVLCREAQQALRSEAERQEVANKTLALLPDSYQTALVAKDADQLLAAIEGDLQKNLLAYTDIANLYLISPNFPTARQSLLAWAKGVPLSGSGRFRSVRQLFKAAEFREDAELYGLLAYRLQSSRSNFDNNGWGGQWIDGKYVRFSDELKKPTSALAFSKQSRAYLLRRVKRTLRRKGQLGDLSYVDLAVGILLNYSDADEQAPSKQDFWTYSQDANNRWHSTKHTINYTGFKELLLLGSILYGNSPRFELNPSKTKWVYRAGQSEQDALPGGREEAFPELWDKRPQGLLHLLAESESRLVHEFASKAARSNLRAIVQLIDLSFIKALFNKSYAVSLQLALDFAKAIYDPAQADLQLLAVMLASPFQAARQQAMQWVDDQAAFFYDKEDFLVQLLFNPFEDILLWLTTFLSKASLSKKQTVRLIAKSIGQMNAYDERSDASERKAILSAGKLMTDHFPEALSTTSFQLINHLLHHPLAEVQAFGARILLHHQTPPEQLPEDLLLGLINGPIPDIRQTGVALLANMPTDALLKKIDLIKVLCVSAYPEVRQSVRPIVSKLAEENQVFGEKICIDLIPYFLQKESYEGRDEDLMQLFTESLREHLHTLNAAVCLKLLFSNRQIAHQLGAFLLQNHIQQDELTIRQIVQLGSNELVVVRNWVQHFYQSQAERVREELMEAVRLMDAKWEDSRDFAFHYFRTQFNEADWTPEVLVSICDSAFPMVQQFGQELITRHFDQKDGAQYLLQLSQHPSSDLQTFASNYLERFAQDQPEQLVQLKHYFTTVLAGVNKARIAKQRIFDFLWKESLKNKQSAQLIAEILVRQSTTMSIEDKAKCIEILLALQQQYPDIDLPIEVQAPVLYPIKNQSTLLN